MLKSAKKDSCSSPAVALVAAGFCNFKTIIMKLSNLKPNEGQIEGVPSNPRTITEDDFEKLKKSLVNFRKMLSLRPMVVDEDWNILGGNMRYLALCRLRDEGVEGFTDDIPDEWVKQDTTLSAAEKREFVIKDNQQRGRNDWDALANEWDDEELREWDVEAAEWSNQNVNLDDFFNASPEEEQSVNSIKIQIIIPASYEDNLDEIKSAITNTLEKWEGCKIK